MQISKNIQLNYQIKVKMCINQLSIFADKNIAYTFQCIE